MSSNIVVAQAYIADVTEASKRVAAFGRIGAIFGIAFILGPALGGMLGEVDPRIPFLCAGVICIINFFYGLFVLPESLREPSEAPGRAIQNFAMGGHHVPLVSPFFFLVRQSPLPRDGCFRDLPITFLLGISLREGF